MQNAQNAEIQQRVINLVEFYRTKVGKESQIANEAKADKDYWDRESVNMLVEEGITAGGICGEGPHNEIWTKHLMVNEQLLGHFYAKVAGENAEKEVLDQLLPELYDASIFSDEEENFIVAHFREMVNYIVQTPCNDLAYVNRYDNKDIVLIPDEILSLIKSRVNIPSGSTIYNPFAGFGQLACLYIDCKSYCGIEIAASDSEDNKEYQRFLWAWFKVSMYANEINAEIVEDGPSDFDAAVSYIPNLPKVWESVKRECDGFSIHDDVDNGYDPKYVGKVERMFDNLKDNGKMVIVTRKNYFYEVDSPLKPLLTRLVAENAIVEIIQLPHVMSMSLLYEDSFVMLVAEKGRKSGGTTMIDASETFKKCDDKHFRKKFDMDAFTVLLNNSGKDPNTGLRKLKRISPAELKADNLIPQIYVIERPDEKESPRPLSNLCTLVTTKIADVSIPVNEVLPWVKSKDLSVMYHGAVNTVSLNKIGVSKEVGANLSKELDQFGVFLKKEEEVSDLVYLTYRMCTYVSGQEDVIVFNFTDKGVETALIKACDAPIAVDSELFVLRLNKGIDAESILALIRMPIVYRQILAYKDYYLYDHLGDILVPMDKRVISDESSRMRREEAVTTNMRNNYIAEQEKHKAKLEDYQHAMRKHIREISSSVRRMERFINDLDSSEEVKKFLNDRLTVIKTHRLFLSEDIERLNEENTYGEAFPFDIDHSLRNYREYFGFDVCPIKYTNVIANDAIRNYRQEHHEMLKKLDEKSKKKRLEVVLAENSLAYVDIAEYNFGKIVRNILENAKKHGFDDFTDVNREDRIIEIALNWDKERQMYRIDFRNNGNPLPEGLTKASYGENRKYAGKTGGTGIGGYEVAENVRHYNGDYAILQDGDWIVVSIYLPKSTTYDKRL